PPFEIPVEIYQAWNARVKGDEREQKWNTLFAAYQNAYPDAARELLRRVQKRLPENWLKIATALMDEMYQKKETMATRKASQICLNHFTKILPELIGGSADLTGSNLTNWHGVQAFSKTTPQGCYIHYGVREFGMSA